MSPARRTARMARVCARCTTCLSARCTTRVRARCTTCLLGAVHDARVCAGDTVAGNPRAEGGKQGRRQPSPATHGPWAEDSAAGNPWAEGDRVAGNPRAEGGRQGRRQPVGRGRKAGPPATRGPRATESPATHGPRAEGSAAGNPWAEGDRAGPPATRGPRATESPATHGPRAEGRAAGNPWAGGDTGDRVAGNPRKKSNVADIHICIACGVSHCARCTTRLWGAGHDAHVCAVHDAPFGCGARRAS
eukprot:gene1736-46866_t